MIEILGFFSLLLNQGNVGLIFTKGDLKEVKEEIAKYKVLSMFIDHVLFLYL